MIQLQFGNSIVETELDVIDLEDLVHGKSGEIATLILKAIKEDHLTQIRDSIKSGDINKAQNLEGYISCLEDFEEFLNVSLKEIVKTESKSEL